MHPCFRDMWKTSALFYGIFPPTQLLGIYMEWARITWFPENGIEKIHPNDREIFGNGIQGHIVSVAGIEDSYQIINLAGNTVRVNPSVLEKCEEPKFKIGDKVKTIKPRTEKTGFIAVITWHFKKEEAIYHLKNNGPIEKSRYYTSELENA